MTDVPNYLVRNRRAWDAWAKNYVESGRRGWATDEVTWGIWNVPESELTVLPDMTGKDVIEIGCGTAYFSAWWPDAAPASSGSTTPRCNCRPQGASSREFGLSFPLIHASAEAVPLPDASFDLAISEYGASIWSDPYRWIPEASRVLRTGGQLIFLRNGTLLMLCMPDAEDEPAAERLLRPYFGMHRFDWPEGTSVEFHLGYGDWIRLLRRHGFEIEDLIEIQAPEGASTRHPYVTPAWARRWPAEEIWKVRKRVR